MSDNAVEEILGQIPADQLAQALGTDEGTALQAARAVIPTLIGGMQHNAGDLAGEQSLAGALLQHEASSLLDGGQVDLGQVDTADGAKIIQHIFGEQTNQLAYALGSRSGGGQSLFQKLLPILAPIVLAYLAKKINAGMQSQSSSGGGILGDILNGGLGSILGGGQQAPQQQSYPQQGYPQQQQAPDQGLGGGILGSILGSILGGGGLGSILGGGQADQGYQDPTPQQSYPQQSYPQQGYPQQQAPQNPFNPNNPNDPGNLQIDDSAPTTADGRPLPGSYDQQQRDGGQGGGGLGDILGSIFGRR